MASQQGGSAGYQFNSFSEIKSHSSILYNQRMSLLFYGLDMHNLRMHKTHSIDAIYDVHSTLRQIYKNARMLLRFNPVVRATLNLETQEPGTYTIDVAMSTISKMINYCEEHGFTQKRVYIIIQELDNAEMLLKDILQYFSYFIRPDFSQKPDVDKATERYKEMADKRTVEELRQLVGKNHKINFDELGSERIEREQDQIDYDPTVDGNIEEYTESDKDDDKIYLDEDEDNEE